MSTFRGPSLDDTVNDKNEDADDDKDRATLSDAAQSTVHDIFTALDKNHDGKLQVPEIKGALAELGLPRSRAYLHDIIKQYDADGDGSIDWPEFRRYVEKKEKIVQRTFAKLDVDKSGYIDADELTKALRKLWMSVSAEDSQHMIDMLDADRDNRISIDEFRRFVYLLPESLMTPTNIVYALVDSSDWIQGVELRLCMTPPKQPFQRLIAGGVAGMVSRASVAPFERMRTMYMVRQADGKSLSMGGCAQKIYKEGGMSALFKGNFATMVKVAPQTAIQFAVYDTITDAMYASLSTVEQASGIPQSRQLSKWQHLLAGCAAGAAATVVTYPLETLRTHMAVGGQSYRQCLSDVVKAHGHRGLYNGFLSGLMSSTVSNGLGFASYETGLSMFRQLNEGVTPGPAERGIIAGGAAVTVMAVIQPLEVCCRRMQVQGREGFPVKYNSVWHCAYQVVKEEGIASFWHGSMCSFMKVAPSIAAVRFVYELLVQEWGINGLRRYRANDTESQASDPPWA